MLRSYTPSRLPAVAVRALGVLIGLVVGSMFAAAAFAQEARWQAHTSLREITALSSADGALWAATTGGIFRYDAAAGGEMVAFTAAEALHSVQTRAIAFDAERGVVWIGYRDGVLDRLDPESGAVKSYLDIARAERFTAREINRLVVSDGALYIATAFGVVVFDPDGGEVRDTYSRLGTFAPGTPVYDLAIAPVPDGSMGLWLATESGVAFASLSTPNLQDPAAWRVETAGLPAAFTRSIAYFDGSIYAGTDAGLAVRQADGTYADVGVTNRAVMSLHASDDRLLGVERFAVLAVEAGGAARLLTVPGYTAPVAIAETVGDVWVGDRQGGLLRVEVPAPPATAVSIVQERVFPDGPFHNAFADLVVDDAGKLWAAGGLAPSDQPDLGFYSFDPQQGWTSYTSSLVPELQGRTSFERIHVDPSGNVWAASSGGGLVRVTPEGAIEIFTPGNSSFQSASGSSDFVLVGGVASERDGTLWVTTRGAPTDLHVRTPDGTWTALPNFSCDGFSTNGMTLDRITIDAYGQKWIVVLDEFRLASRIGLLVLDTGADPVSTADDACQFFNTKGSSGQQLPSTSVSAVVEDRDGLVWIGTETGLAYLINNGVVARDPLSVPIWPQQADRSQGIWLLNGSGLNIRDLAVDPANRLWVATDLGAYLIEATAGGFQVVEHLTTLNSPLFSNSVLSVAIAPATGRVYFATDQGLLSFEGEAIAPAEQAQGLKVYPNPARAVDGALPAIFIEGLVDATELRVLTPDGRVVARLTTRGGRVRWDGRDLDDRLVPSGMYLVVAVGQKGEGTAYGKVAIIR